MRPGSDRFTTRVRSASRPLPLPLASSPGLALTGAKVRDLVTNPQVQCDVQIALHQTFHTPAVLTAMDLSAEAEAFGAAVHLSDDEVPTVPEPLLEPAQATRSLAIPSPGDKRTAVYLEAVRRLRAWSQDVIILGGCIGPFSLASRLAGVTEALTLSATDPGVLHELVGKCTEFLKAYVQAYRSAGADGVIMAEPSAGLLSPAALAAFSSPYVRQVVEAVTREGPFALVLHNCAARLVHLPAVLEARAPVLHFGAPMDLPAALSRVGPEPVVCGNLDPMRVFCQGDPTSVAESTRALLAATGAPPNLVLSSGCDLPRHVPLENLAAFFAAARGDAA